MIKQNKVLALGMAALIAAVIPMNAWAVSPEFARTPEEWAQLRDNVMEYEELAGLIKEYNSAVQNNQISYDDFKRKYGESKDDVAREYRNMANEILDNIVYPDPDDDGYELAMAGAYAKESQAIDMRVTADENVNDSMVTWLGYQSAEATLVTVAQTNMITYHQKQLELQKELKRRELLDATYQSVVAKQGVGMATQLEALNALEAVQNQDQKISTLQSDIKNIKQKLCTMLGWQYNAEPEIREIPHADQQKIEQIDQESDKSKALEMNYTIKTNKRKCENAGSGATKDSLEITLKDNEEKVKSSVTTAYHSILTAKIAYDRVAVEAQTEAQNMAHAEQKFQLGTISRLEYQEQQFNTFEKQIDQQTADMNLLQAMENYYWAVNGLAAAQ